MEMLKCSVREWDCANAIQTGDIVYRFNEQLFCKDIDCVFSELIDKMVVNMLNTVSESITFVCRNCVKQADEGYYFEDDDAIKFCSRQCTLAGLRRMGVIEILRSKNNLLCREEN